MVDGKSVGQIRPAARVPNPMRQMSSRDRTPPFYKLVAIDLTINTNDPSHIGTSRTIKKKESIRWTDFQIQFFLS